MISILQVEELEGVGAPGFPYYVSTPSSTGLTKCSDGMLILFSRDSSIHGLVFTTLRVSTVTWVKRCCDVKTHK